MAEEKSVTQTSENKDIKKATVQLKDLSDAASLVEKYARRMVESGRAQQFSTAIAVMAQKDPLFKQANPMSVVTGMMACVHLNLMPNTPEQYAYLIPYRNNRSGGVDIQFQVGYKGLIEMAYRSSQIKSMNAELVFKGDKFDVELGSDRRLVHKPSFDIDRTKYDDVTHAYMTAKLENGDVVFEVMTRKELDKIQQSAKAKSTDTPWHKWPEMMARKTVIKRGVKLLPSSGEDNRLAFAAAVDSWAEAGKLKFESGNIIEGEVADDNNNDRRARMIAASNRAQKRLNGGNHTAKAVQTSDDDDIDDEDIEKGLGEAIDKIDDETEE